MFTIMRVLIDTNILIYREDDHVLSNNIQKLLATLHTIGTEILIHPASLDDLKKDPNKERREIILSKIRTYTFLEKPPRPEVDFEYLNIIASETADNNDAIDSKILYAVYKDAVDFLITEDRGIHKKAHKLLIDDRVLLISDAIQILDRYIPKASLIPPFALREEYVYNLNPKDPIFESLKKDYEEFDLWLNKIKRQGRECLVHFREDGYIGALLIYKIEDEAIDSNPPLPKKKRLKISTFKVTHVGYKLGELLIKLSTDIARKNNISEIYLTHFTEELEDRLVELINEYGFYKAAKNPRGEEIYLKRLTANTSEVADLSPLEVAKKYYPSLYDGKTVKKFIVPIRPEYHDRLFTDFYGRQATLPEYAGDFIVEGNTIKKAYICHSKANEMNSGDILIFYVSERKLLTSVGVVESIDRNIIDTDSVIKRVGKRTVYSRKEIEDIVKIPTTVILFRHHFHINKLITLSQLKRMGVLSGAPQSIMRINDTAYQKIKAEGGIDVRFVVH